jgi:hypothetical protein
MRKIWESRSFVSCLLSLASLEYPSQRDAQSKNTVRCTSRVNWKTLSRKRPMRPEEILALTGTLLE